jgi:hypothetical protein
MTDIGMEFGSGKAECGMIKQRAEAIEVGIRNAELGNEKEEILYLCPNQLN